ncbi:alkaline shock response membrane anchor protein AmaP [Amycolatopsis thermoflava]|uniref:alkaline shock response membrane anchor protein AmaP n=1 Tax=Amycolatopsis thermoflava TaxID=84480 RepID=UPI00366587F7
MPSLNRPARLNRSLLILFGLLLIAAGSLTLATHFRALTVIDPDAPLVPGTAAPPTWAYYATVAGAILAGLLALRWLLAQLAHKPKSRTWRLESDPDTGRTELPAAVAVAPLTEEIRGYPSVHDAHATLAGERDNAALALVVTAEQDTNITVLRKEITTTALPRLRQALDLDNLSTTLEVRFASATPTRSLQ